MTENTLYMVMQASSYQQMPMKHSVTMSYYHIILDANLIHDVSTGRSVTGILHLANKPPLNSVSRHKQQWRQQLLVPNLLLDEYVLNR
jgi:hypothetical protein